MKIQPLHTDFIMPTKGSDQAGAFDLYMLEAGTADGISKMFPLGFKAAIPPGNVALLLPRSSAGAKYGLELANTCGVIDADYRGEWMAAIKTKTGLPYSWAKGDRVLQFLLVPVTQVTLEAVDTLENTTRGTGGFGSSGL